MGRPTSLTPEVQAKVVEAVSQGGYAEPAARAAGVSRATFFVWIKRGEDGEEPYATFLDAVKEAEQVAELAAIAVVRAHPPNWQALAWYLERKFPERWGRRDPEYALKRKTMRTELDTLKAKLKLLEAGHDPDATTINVVIPDALRRNGE